MNSDDPAITVTSRALSTGGVLLTVNDDRRIELHAPLSQVEEALVSGKTTGFVGEMRALVEQTRDQINYAAHSTHVVIQADAEIGYGAGQTLLKDFIKSTASTVNFIDKNLPDRLDPETTLVTLHNQFDYDRLTRIEDIVHASSSRWAPFWRDPSGARFGPFQQNQSGPSIRDLAARWVSAANKDSHGRALLRPPTTVLTAPSVTPLESTYEIVIFLKDVALWLGGGRPLAWWHTVRLDRSGKTTADPVLPMPQRIASPEPLGASGLTPMDVINTRTGIVTRLRNVSFRTPMPPAIRYVESQTADMSRLAPWASNIHNAGSSWGDDEQARSGAVGEAIERYCGNVVDHSRLVHGSFDELTRTGIRVVDPHELVLFSAEQYADRRFPFVPFERTTRTQWVAGRSLVDDTDILVPASLTFVNWNVGRSAFSPRCNPAYYPGIAAGLTRDAALANALEEVIERDAAMVWWWSGSRLPVAADATPALERLLPAAWSADHDIRAYATPLTSAVGLPAVAVAVEAPALGLITIGLAARRTAEDALAKGLLEALGLLESALDMQDSQGGFWRTYKPGQGQGAVRPIRTDRRYLDSYRDDFRDVTDLYCQLQIQLDPRSTSIVASRFGKPKPGVLAQLPRFDHRDQRDYVRAITAAGFEPVAVDLTTSDVAAAGWHVSRVVVPGLVPNFPTAFAPLGQRRLQELPAVMGWRDTPIRASDLWSFPMPYA